MVKANKKTYPNVSIGKTGLCQGFRQTKITKFDLVRLVEKYCILYVMRFESITLDEGQTIIWLQIPMEDLGASFIPFRFDDSILSEGIGMMAMLQS